MSSFALNHLASSGAGRVVLHLIAMAGDRAFAFHTRGILRELGVGGE